VGLLYGWSRVMLTAVHLLTKPEPAAPKRMHSRHLRVRPEGAYRTGTASAFVQCDVGGLEKTYRSNREPSVLGDTGPTRRPNSISA
jgi:hypothetical protein